MRERGLDARYGRDTSGGTTVGALGRGGEKMTLESGKLMLPRIDPGEDERLGLLEGLLFGHEI